MISENYNSKLHKFYYESFKTRLNLFEDLSLINSNLINDTIINNYAALSENFKEINSIIMQLRLIGKFFETFGRYSE